MEWRYESTFLIILGQQMHSHYIWSVTYLFNSLLDSIQLAWTEMTSKNRNRLFIFVTLSLQFIFCVTIELVIISRKNRQKNLKRYHNKVTKFWTFETFLTCRCSGFLLSNSNFKTKKSWHHLKRLTWSGLHKNRWGRISSKIALFNPQITPIQS